MAKINLITPFEASAFGKKVRVAIFFHTTQLEEKRDYWVGTLTEDGSACQRTIKAISGKGQKALDRAIKYLDEL